MLDRIDSNKSYEEGNVFWVHKDINVMRWEFDLSYFRSLCSMIIAPKDKLSKKDLEIKPKNKNWKGHGNIGLKYWGDVIRASKGKRRGREIGFSVDIKDAWSKFVSQGGLCALSGRPIDFSCHHNERGDASLDRIDSSLDYTIDNIWWLHKDVNRMKWKFDLNYFRKLCKLVVKGTESEIE